MLRPFSSRIYRDRVTFAVVGYGRAARGGATPNDETVGPPLPALIEPVLAADDPNEVNESRPVSTQRWRIRVQSDPSTAFPRQLTADDHAYCEQRMSDGTYHGAFLVQLDGPDPMQGPRWQVLGSQVGNAIVDVPVQGVALLLETGGALLLESGGELLLG